MGDSILAARRVRFGQAIAAADLDLVALVPGPAFYYLTGLSMHLMERPTVLLVGPDGQTLALIPEIERGLWSAAMPATETLYWSDQAGPAAAMARLLSGRSLRRIGVEALRMRVREYDLLRGALPGLAIKDAQDLVSGARVCKDAAEIALVRRAIAISEAALGHVQQQVELGITEAMLRRILIGALSDAGADGLAFDPIVLFGPASADPHGTSSDNRRLAEGDAVLIDFGACHGGYNADITRTWFARSCDQADALVYDAVLAANSHGRSVVGPQMTASDLDDEVRAVLVDRGFSSLIKHKTGHGLGLDVHEYPQIMAGNATVLQPGMLFTIEPALYQDSRVGIRIEDNVVVTETGSLCLTSLPREMEFVG